MTQAGGLRVQARGSKGDLWGGDRGHWDNNYTDRAQTFEPSGTEMMTPSGPASMVGASLAATTVATRENRSNINGKSENRKEQQYIYLLSSPFFLMLKSSCTHNKVLLFGVHGRVSLLS